MNCLATLSPLVSSPFVTDVAVGELLVVAAELLAAPAELLVDVAWAGLGP
jgi:hypothetical protein